MQFHLTGPLNTDYFLEAFGAVVESNAIFWTNFNKKIPMQVINRQGDFDVIFEDFSNSDEVNRLDDWFYTHILELIPLNQQPLIRVFLYKIKDNLHEVHVIIPHIIAEGKSCDLVMEQFKNNYELLIAGKSLTVCSEENNYFSYVHYYNHHCLKNLQEKINFWSEYNQGVGRLYLGSSRHLPDASVGREHYLWNYPLAPHTMEQLMAWHRGKNINISSGLIALSHIVFYALGVKNKLAISLIHTGREGQHYQSTIGLFAEYKRINNTINEDNLFIDCIGFIEEQLLRTAPYQKCPVLLKDNKLLGEQLSFSEFILYLWNKARHSKSFRKTGMGSYINNLYLAYLSRVFFSKLTTLTKRFLKRWFAWSIPLFKPAPVQVLISVTPSFFVKQATNGTIADLQLSYPHHFAYADRPVGNKALWVYFSRDQQGLYQLSLNGPLTKECLDEIAQQFNHIMAKIVDNDGLRISDLVKNEENVE